MKTLKIIKPFFWFGIREKVKKTLEEKIKESPRDKRSSLKFNLLKSCSEASNLIVNAIKKALQEEKFLKVRKFYINRDNLRNDLPLLIQTTTGQVVRRICMSGIQQSLVEDLQKSITDILMRSISNFVSA